MFMIAGPNGAGKSTLYETRIKTGALAPFINADVIQRDELRDPSMEASYKAAEMAETRRREYLQQGKSFVSESTFSHPPKLSLITDALQAGFRVVMYHVNLRSPELSVYRVAYRFKNGGHDVPESKIRERFARNPELIRQAVMQADKAFIYDNSTLGRPPMLVMEFTKGKVVRVSDRVPSWARELYSNELSPFSPARLNPEAASFADAKAIVEKVSGGAAVLRLPHKDNLAHIGPIVGESEKHWVQKVQDGVYVAHFKSKIGQPVELQKPYAITYDGQGLVRITPAPELQPKSPSTTSVANTTTAQIFKDATAMAQAAFPVDVRKANHHRNELLKQHGLSPQQIEELTKGAGPAKPSGLER